MVIKTKLFLFLLRHTFLLIKEFLSIKLKQSSAYGIQYSWQTKTDLLIKKSKNKAKLLSDY